MSDAFPPPRSAEIRRDNWQDTIADLEAELERVEAERDELRKALERITVKDADGDSHIEELQAIAFAALAGETG